MSTAAGFVWRLALAPDLAETAFLLLDEAVEALAAEPGAPALAVDLALPQAACAQDAPPARLAVTMTGADLTAETAHALAAALFAHLEAGLPAGALGGEMPVPEPLAEQDWVRLSQAGLPAQLVGRWRILTAPDHAGFWPGRTALAVTASTAFGTGHHPTTRGVLMMLDALARRRRRPALAPMLDLGCGSGLLGLAMAAVWKRALWASDIDPAVRAVVADHARRNRVALRTRAARGKGPALALVIAPGLHHPLLRRAAPFGLIVANILAGPLKALAPAIAGSLAPDGWLVMSGILEAEARGVIRRYRRFGLIARAVWIEDGWATMALARAGRGRPLPARPLVRRRGADPDAPAPADGQ
ncbi:MAG: hypothetical protein KatS3mg119_1066 [Rhodothalassiaceae bacterium]|nr:MAG: hypothetical protein KatS3mg119_1066 [Rhodothalassiaceae bacterium]